MFCTWTRHTISTDRYGHRQKQRWSQGGHRQVDQRADRVVCVSREEKILSSSPPLICICFVYERRVGRVFFGNLSVFCFTVCCNCSIGLQENQQKVNQRSNTRTSTARHDSKQKSNEINSSRQQLGACRSRVVRWGKPSQSFANKLPMRCTRCGGRWKVVSSLKYSTRSAETLDGKFYKKAAGWAWCVSASDSWGLTGGRDSTGLRDSWRSVLSNLVPSCD